MTKHGKKTGKPLLIPLLLMAVMIFFWAVEWMLIGISNEYVDMYSGTSARFAIGAVVMALLMVIFRIPVPLDRESVILYAVVWIFSFIIPYFFCYWALQYIESALTALIFAVFPIVVCVAAHFFVPGEQMTFSKFAGVVVGFVGVTLLFLGKMKTPSLEGFWQPKYGVTTLQAVLAMLAVVAATVSWMVQAIYVKVKAKGRHPFAFLFPGMALTALVFAAFSAFHEPPSPNEWALRAWLCIIVLAVFASVLTFGLYFYLLSIFPVSKVSMSAFITPLLSVFLGVTFRREAISLFGWYGIPLIIGGIILVTKPWKAFGNSGRARQQG